MLVLLIATQQTNAQEGPIDPDRAANTIILDEAGVKNLKIKTEMVEERDFETTFFAVGRIEELPKSRAVLSSRIAGRIVDLKAFLGDKVKKGDKLLSLEAMKMETTVYAEQDGTLAEVLVSPGTPVEAGELIARYADA